MFFQKKPKFLKFLKNEDYKFVLYLRKLEKLNKNKEIIEAMTCRQYKYSKYEWQVCLDALRTYENYQQYTLPKIKKMKKCGIKNVELLCNNSCQCCNSKIININEVKELPMPECELDIKHCIGATYCAVVEFNVN